MNKLFAQFGTRKTLILLVAIGLLKAAFVLGGLALAFFSTSVVAKEEPSALPGNDAALSIDEARMAFAGQFAAMDRNKDGVLSEDEYVGARLAKLFDLDTDKDGAVSRGELHAQSRAPASPAAR